MRSDFSLNSNQCANDRVIIHSISTDAFSGSHLYRPSSVHGGRWYNSERLVRVRERKLAKVWRASRAEFNSRARSLYGIGAQNRICRRNMSTDRFYEHILFYLVVEAGPYTVVLTFLTRVMPDEREVGTTQKTAKPYEKSSTS